ncbi:unnamed protein product [Acanthoscelides obtectus]|uniref:Uncharacterized protein n=1 Tax=Acanthoscelides obtectus TaxID=200917 RepID=A0A9P0JUG8_ACAOB|nr:unnamed protein product [Acanthoscelides obtectus]CAK1666997.1 hypothetical protein AOBTE_LOCUS25610 [Acanthoscelides obtectus]
MIEAPLAPKQAYDGLPTKKKEVTKDETILLVKRVSAMEFIVAASVNTTYKSDVDFSDFP